MTQTLFFLRGPQASGKTSFALNWLAQKPDERARVNRDSLRMGNFGAYSLPNRQENIISKMEYDQVEMLLKNGFSVIIDNMNLRNKYIKPYLELAEKYGVTVMHKDFIIELNEAIRRNANRDRVVPEDVLRRTYASFIRKGAFTPFPTLDTYEAANGIYVPDVSKPTAIILDVDGTAMKLSSERGPFDWAKVLLDEPNAPVVEAVKALSDAGHKIIVMSGRDEVCREDTILSLREAGIVFQDIFMRKEGDMRKDSIVKDELFDAHIRYNYNVLFALDDRDAVVAHYRKKLGLTVFQVDYGNF